MSEKDNGRNSGEGMNKKGGFTADSYKGVLRRVGIWGGLAAVLIAAAIYVRLADPFSTEVGEVPGGPSMAPNAVVGIMPGKTEEELRAALTQKTAKSEVAFTVNTTVVFEEGWRGEGDLMMECLPSNQNNLEFVITRDDTGEEIYRSGLLEPGNYILMDRLTTQKAMPKGSYACTTTISSYDRENNAFVGKAQAAVTLTMEK